MTDARKNKGQPIPIFTIGYGLATKEEFQGRFSEIPKADLTVVDVRKFDSKSRNGRWAYQGWEAMGITLKEIGISYTECSELANVYGSTARGLDEYRSQIMPGGDLGREFMYLLHELATDTAQYCLLCAERKPYRPGRIAIRPNCHRVVLAKRLCTELNSFAGRDAWAEVHL